MRRSVALLAAGWLAVTLCTTAPVTRAATAPGSPPRLEDTLRYAGRTLAKEPVDARIDRVWHAVPGLCGWQLDVPESIRLSKAKHDGRVHLAWRSIPPRVRLADLPPEPIYRGPEQERSVCLMFNVSWGEQYIPSILRTLKQSGVKATFFLDGAWVKKHPDLARQIVADGHAIGSHGSGHPDFRTLTSAKLYQQIQGTNDLLQQEVGVRPRVLAPPAGAYDERTVRMARNAGMYTILWTVDTVDWRKPPASLILQRVLAGVEPGALILMHPTEPTAKALPSVIGRLQADGYQFKTVDQVVLEQTATAPPAVLQR
ncbi:MAG: polysaccharide deacetylase family protein [Thermoflavifilum sp.]|nr:polysaccharide deacetylase family protein [Thermoflavifilum sp.]MCL6513425.1 polysaccharide deacetylase family protein [Alicyclobacillus sp.]